MNMIYNRFTFEYFLESTARLGFKSFELWAGSPQFCNYDSNVSGVARIRRLVEQSGLKITCVTGEQAIYAVNMAARDEKLRQASIEYFKTLIRQAGELGVDKYLMSIGWGCYDETLEESWKRGCDSGEQVLKEAERAGVNILWEVMPKYTTSHIHDLASAKRIVHDLDSPYSRLCVDTCAIAVVNEPLEIYFRELRDKVYHIHLNDGEPDNFLVWGDGTQPLEQHLRDLARNDYRGAMTMEVCDSRYFQDPHTAIARGLRVLLEKLPCTV